MRIEIIPCLQDNYSYLVIDEKENNACVIDPGESAPIIKYLDDNKINLKFILNTHHHYDHIDGNKDLKKKYQAKILGYQGEVGIILLSTCCNIWVLMSGEGL